MFRKCVMHVPRYAPLFAADNDFKMGQCGQPATCLKDMGTLTRKLSLIRSCRRATGLGSTRAHDAMVGYGRCG